MLVDSINVVDVVLEGFKAICMLFLFIIMSRAGAKYPQLSKGPWKYILLGFFLMFLGFLADTSDEIINYEVSASLDTVQSMFEELTLIIGLILTTIGFSNWFQFVGRFLGLKSQ
jgi:hypothetical protein